jgi:hypothetical protein
MPAYGLREHAADEQTYRATRGGDEGEYADGLRLLPRLGKHRDDHAKDHGRGHGAASALHETGRDEQLLALRNSTKQRSQRKHPEAHQEHLPAGDEVPQPPGEQQQAAEGDQIRVDDPRQTRLRETKVVLNRR